MIISEKESNNTTFSRLCCEVMQIAVDLGERPLSSGGLPQRFSPIIPSEIRILLRIRPLSGNVIKLPSALNGFPLCSNSLGKFHMLLNVAVLAGVC